MAIRPDDVLKNLECVGWKAGIAALVSFGFAQAASAAAPTVDADYLRPGTPRSTAAVTVGATYSDNVKRIPTNEVSDTAASIGLLIDTRRDGTRLDYSASGDINWLDYLDNTYKSQVYGVLDGNVKFGLVPDRFDWNVRESYNRLLIDPVGAATPDNVERFNYLTTGPRFAALFGAATELSLDASYSVVSTQDQAASTLQTSLDSDRYQATLALARAISGATKAGLSVTTQKVKYDDDAASDYDRDEASIYYNSRIARTAISTELGISRIRLSDDSPTGLLARIGLAHKVSASSTVTLGVARQTADSADIVRSGSGAQRPGDAPILAATRDPFVDRTFSLGWEYARGRNNFGLDVFRTEEQYLVTTTRDRTLTGGGAYFERRLRPALTFNVSARYQKEDLDQIGAGSKDTEGVIGLTWNAGVHLRIALQGERYKRSGVGTSDYTENRIGVRFGYDFLRGGGA